MRESCESCRFYDLPEGQEFGLGLCLRYPPRIVERLLVTEIINNSSVYQASVYPVCSHVDWCGEYKQKR